MNHSWLAVLACLGAVCPATAEDLGRLFFSGAERATLDAARYAARKPALDLVDEATGKRAPEPAAPAPPPPVRVDGIVTRNRTPATVWLDGEPQAAGDAEWPGATLRVTPGEVELRDGEQGTAVRIKPGQTFDPVSGEVSASDRSRAVER